MQVEVNVQAPVACLAIEALAKWHLGEIASCKALMVEAISLAKESNDMHSVALALCHAAILACLEDNPVEVERFAWQVIELSTRQNFVQWLYGGSVYRGWARSASGQTVEGILRIEDAIRDALAAGWTLTLPLCAARSPIMTQGAIMFPVVTRGMIDPSAAKCPY